jgi:hypothetical protein
MKSSLVFDLEWRSVGQTAGRPQLSLSKSDQQGAEKCVDHPIMPGLCMAAFVETDVTTALSHQDLDWRGSRSRQTQIWFNRNPRIVSSVKQQRRDRD